MRNQTPRRKISLYLEYVKQQNWLRVLLTLSVVIILFTNQQTLAAESDAVSSTALTFTPCTITLESYEIDAQCATFQRPENPSNPDSRIIDLSVIKLPSHSPEPEPDAFTVIQGGPGGSSIDLVISFRQVFDEIRRKRDILVIDQRGTGRSNVLTCDITDNLVASFNPEVVKKQSKQCADELSQHSDLRYYTTSIAVDDLEALRIAAAYPALNIYGISYGTRVAQHYLRKYPKSVRSVVLDGVAHIGLNLAGGEIARRWEDGFRQLNQRCQLDESCNSVHGDLREKYIALKQRFANQNITTTLPHPLTAEATEYTFTEDSLFSALRLMFYSTEQSALIPLLLSEATKGNYQFVAAQIIQLEETFSDQFAIGMHNAVVCAEDVPFVKEEDIAKADDTLIGRQMSQALQASCEVWPRGYIDADFHKTFSSDVPVLVLSGETDPITPAANGEIATKMLGNAKHIVVPAHGHGVIARGCITKLVSNYIKDVSFTGIDTSCVEREQAMPIFSSPTGPRP